MEEVNVKKEVRDRYAGVAKNSCGTGATSCCSGNTSTRAKLVSKAIGYSDTEMDSVPEGANLGLGCGNPTALASLKEGEVVLDLGSGAGFDCFLAANKVGKKGRVIGVDMTPEMLDTARQNARKGGYQDVEFRLGEIENLPCADNSVDVIISNCVINLSPDKKQVFGEAFRVLKPGGRIMVSDIVLLKALPAEIKQSIAAYVGCVAGAMKKDDYLKTIRAVGFEDVDVVESTSFPIDYITGDPVARELMGQMGLSREKMRETIGSVVSVKVKGTKPK